MPVGDALVAKALAEVVHVLQAPDETAVEVQLDGDAQRHLLVQRVVMGQERARRGAPRERLQHGRFDLDEAPLGHERPQRVDRARARHEQLARGLIREQIELAVAVARAGVAEPVVLGGRGAQRLCKERALVHAQRELPALGHIHAAARFHDVTDVQIEHPFVGVLSERVLAHAKLDLAGGVAEVHERRLAVPASGDEPSRETVGEARVLARLQLGGVVRGVQRRDLGALSGADVGERLDAPRAQALRLGDALVGDRIVERLIEHPGSPPEGTIEGLPPRRGGARFPGSEKRRPGLDTHRRAHVPAPRAACVFTVVFL